MTQSTILFTCICVAIFIAIVIGGGIHIHNEIMRIHLVERRVIREVLSNPIYSKLIDDRYNLYSRKYKHVFNFYYPRMNSIIKQCFAMNKWGNFIYKSL